MFFNSETVIHYSLFIKNLQRFATQCKGGVSMNILTKRNGVALVAVLAVLLVLTLLLPLMFTYSENAMEKAMTGTDEQRAAYLARSMIEMTVLSFEEIYDEGESEISSGIPTTAEEEELAKKNDPSYKGDYTTTTTYRLNQFYDSVKKMYPQDLYMYENLTLKANGGEFKTKDEMIAANAGLQRQPNETDVEWRRRIETAYMNYSKNGMLYSTTVPSGYTAAQARQGAVPSGATASIVDLDGVGVSGGYIGYSKCEIEFIDEPDYYKYVDGVATRATEQEYNNYIDACKPDANGNVNIPDIENSVFKVDNKYVDFSATAAVNGRVATRKCRVVLPTKPSEENWITPANIEGHQIFPDTSLASGVTKIDVPAVGDDAAMKQPVYMFSCVGNMIFTKDNLKYKQTKEDALSTSVLPKGQLMDYNKYVDAYNTAVQTWNTDNPDDQKDLIANRSADLSLGLHPETTTVKPESDPLFSCIKTNNMNSWAGGARKDNFVAFTATKGIQIDMPINLIINPCRTGRIGDGISPNKSLYKILYLQAPDIVFNGPVNSMISLYTSAFTAGKYRMSSIILAAPSGTPYSYVHPSRTDASGEFKTVRAGKVYFAEDVYMWVVPFSSNGSNYHTQSVYYKGKDIILYKLANAGDIYYFNSEVETINQNGQNVPAGFSLSAYFMDVIYEDMDGKTGAWYEIWGNLKSHLYDQYLNHFKRNTYVEGDFKWVANMRDTGEAPAEVDSLYVIWDS